MNKQFKLGAEVWLEDGRGGRLDKVVVDPEKQQPRYLVVKRGRVNPRRVVVPVSLVSDVSPDNVSLAMTRKALQDFPDYEVTVREGQYRKPVPVGYPRARAVYVPLSNRDYVSLRQRSVPEGSLSIQEGMDVIDAAGLKVGEVEGVLLDEETRQGTDIVVRHEEPRLTRRRVVPIDLVADVSEEEVTLRIEAMYMQGLGVYRPAPRSAEA